MTENTWNKYWGEKSNWEYWLKPDPEIDSLVKTLDKQKVRDVLDLGCGIGRHTLLLAKAGFNVTAVDSSKEALASLAAKGGSTRLKIKLVQGNFSKDIFLPDSFDLIIAYNAIYHGYRENFERAVRLIRKWLRPGGLFYFTCLSQRDDKYSNGEEIAPNTFKSLNSIHPGDIHYFASEDEIQDWLGEFSIISKNLKEHYWDNKGTKQLSSYWQILAREE